MLISFIVGRPHESLLLGAFRRAASCSLAERPQQIRLLTACEKSEGEEAKVREKKQQSHFARANGSRTTLVQDQPSTPCSVAALRTQVGMNALRQEQNIASDANPFFFFWRPAY